MKLYRFSVQFMITITTSAAKLSHAAKHCYNNVYFQDKKKIKIEMKIK